jgi:hypothetical protein
MRLLSGVMHLRSGVTDHRRGGTHLRNSGTHLRSGGMHLRDSVTDLRNSGTHLRCGVMDHRSGGTHQLNGCMLFRGNRAGCRMQNRGKGFRGSSGTERHTDAAFPDGRNHAGRRVYTHFIRRSRYSRRGGFRRTTPLPEAGKSSTGITPQQNVLRKVNPRQGYLSDFPVPELSAAACTIRIFARSRKLRL